MNREPSRLSEPELQKAAPHPLTGDELMVGGALLSAPIGWALHLALSYGLLYPAERWHAKAALYAVSVLLALPALGSLLLGSRCLRRSRADASVAPLHAERTRFIGLCACGAGVFFLLAIIAATLPVVLLPLRRP